MLIESLNNRLRELELEVEEMKQIAEHTTHEYDRLRPSLQDTESMQDKTEKIFKTNVKTKAKAAEDLFLLEIK